MKKHFLFSCGLFIAVNAVAASPGYHLTGKIQIGGQGFWDYLSIDSNTRRLYVSHDSYVAVVDLNTDQVVANIPDTPGVHGIALAPELGRGFISCGRANKVFIFDLSSLEILGEVATGANPDGILYDSASRRVFTSNARSGDMTVFDAATGAALGTIALGGKGESPHTDGNGKIYTNIEDSSEVVEIDIQKLSVTNRFPIAPGEEPTGLAIDPARHRIFSGCGNRIMTVLDIETGKVIGQVPIGERCDGVEYDEETGYIFCANGEGTLTIVQESSPGNFEVVDTVATRQGARTLTIDPDTHTVYLPVGQMGPPPGSGPAGPTTKPATDDDSFVVLAVGR